MLIDEIYGRQAVYSGYHYQWSVTTASIALCIFFFFYLQCSKLATKGISSHWARLTLCPFVIQPRGKRRKKTWKSRVLRDTLPSTPAEMPIKAPLSSEQQLSYGVIFRRIMINTNNYPKGILNPPVSLLVYKKRAQHFGLKDLGRCLRREHFWQDGKPGPDLGPRRLLDRKRTWVSVVADPEKPAALTYILNARVRPCTAPEPEIYAAVGWEGQPIWGPFSSPVYILSLAIYCYCYVHIPS